MPVEAVDQRLDRRFLWERLERKTGTDYSRASQIPVPQGKGSRWIRESLIEPELRHRFGKSIQSTGASLEVYLQVAQVRRGLARLLAQHHHVRVDQSEGINHHLMAIRIKNK